jgi:pheromone shutdown protein TraB
MHYFVQLAKIVYKWVMLHGVLSYLSVNLAGSKWMQMVLNSPLLNVQQVKIDGVIMSRPDNF